MTPSLTPPWLRGPRVALLALAAVAPGRGGSGPAPEPAQELGPPPIEVAGAEDPHAEVRRLLREIEHRLGEIDARLNDSTDGAAEDAPEDAPGGADLAGFLRGTQDEMQRVVDDIDRVLRIRDHHPPGGS